MGCLPRLDAELERTSSGVFASKGDTFLWVLTRSPGPCLGKNILRFAELDLPTHLVDQCPLPLKALALPTNEEDKVVQLALKALDLADPVYCASRIDRPLSFWS